MVRVLQIPVGVTKNFSYIVWDEETGTGAVIDPAFDTPKILRLAEENRVRIRYILNTHGHHDHIEGNGPVSSRTGAKVVCHEDSGVSKDIGVRDGDELALGRSKIRIIHTPGHSPDSISVLAEGNLFTGDALFVGECGRTDLPGGDSRRMYESLFGGILKLGDEVKVFPGHDYGPMPHSTIREERRTNYTLKERTLDEFIQFMKEP